MPSNQELKCAVPNCFAESILEKEPCSVCGKLVHHMCSNSIFETDLNMRFCSDQCVSNHQHGLSNTTTYTNAITTSQLSQPTTHPDSGTSSSTSAYVSQSQNQSQLPQVIDSDLLVSEEESSDMDIDAEDNYDILESEDELEESSTTITPETEIQNALEAMPEQPSDLDYIISKPGLTKLQWNASGRISEDVQDICRNKSRIKCRSLILCTTPVEVFMHLFPETLWNSIVEESNKYRVQNVWSSNVKEIKREELMKFVGLLIARSVMQWSNGLKYHWRSNSVGPFPNGTFGEYLSRDRYKEICRCLHFADNNNIAGTNDKFYKVAPLIHTLNRTFENAIELGGVVSYDEATIATVSRYVPCKVYNGMKPHKWGIKLHMVCCAETGYCSKFEVYKGKFMKDGTLSDCPSGPSSLLRNVKYLSHSRRVIFCDRYYTSVVLFIQLLAIGLYACGTIMTNRVGFPKNIKMKKNEKLPRGTTRIATSQIAQYGTIAAVAWQDTKPVHLISTGLHTNDCRVFRRARGEREKRLVQSVNVIKRYQECMNGVDRHDYLRMARYSVQTKHVFKKWYKTFFTAMVDLVLVNSLIVWRMIGHKQDHCAFNEAVAHGLLTIYVGRMRASTPVKRRILFPSGSLNFDGHQIMRYNIDEGYNGRERRYRRCIVCQAFNRRAHSENYCSECKVCVCVRANDGQQICWNILHQDKRIQERVLKRHSIQRRLHENGNSSDPLLLTPRERRKRQRESLVSSASTEYL
jgi:hypothetical protein